MKSLLLVLTPALLLSACWRQYEQNPDPNHTHADFAVWVDGEMVDFSGPEYMSGLSYSDESHDEEHEYHHEHLHLHDEVGTVLHRHKPGLTLKEFFDSLGYRFDARNWRMFLNNPSVKGAEWQEVDFDLSYVFMDMDMVLITDSASDVAVTVQQDKMTEEACLYSRTCPWKGDPPAENCVADPAIPCVVPEEDL